MMMQLGRPVIVCGVSRLVVIIGDTAFKFPYPFSWRRFLLGLLANMTERTWWGFTQDVRLCPIRFSLPGGFLNVMPRCEALQPSDKLGDTYADYYIRRYDDLPVENKADSFGYYQGNLVAIDYGDIFSKGTL